MGTQLKGTWSIYNSCAFIQQTMLVEVFISLQIVELKEFCCKKKINIVEQPVRKLNSFLLVLSGKKNIF